MDACLGYLHEVDVLMESYIELPLYQDIFEATDPEVATATAKNAEIEEKSMNLLQKSLKLVRDIFGKIKEMIKTIFTWVGMSKDEKTVYAQFVEECKRNPEFAGMKVSIHDYRAINEEYNKTLKQYENEYTKIRGEEEEARPTLGKSIKEGLDKIKNKVAKIAAAEASAFTVEAVLNYAKACRENAAKVEFMLNFDIGLLDELEKQLGKKEIKKFKKKVKALQSKIPVVRYIAGGRQEQVKTLRDSLKETITNVREVAKIHGKARNKNSAAAEDIKDVEKGVGKVGKAGVKFAGATGKAVLEKRSYVKNAYKRQMKLEKNTVAAAQKEALKENERRNKN